MDVEEIERRAAAERAADEAKAAASAIPKAKVARVND
jgi:hypothetical protein